MASSFQQAVVRNVNDKNSQLQKQLDNVVREANGEISLLSSKLMELERDLEVERRKVRELQDTAREKDKEYQKLKASSNLRSSFTFRYLTHSQNQYEKIKRKALLGPGPANLEVPHPGFVGPGPGNPEMHPKLRNHGAPVDLEFVVGGMEANGIQRTPLINRTTGNSFVPQHNSGWAQQLAPMQAHARNHSHRQAFGGHEADRSYRSGNTSDRSESANEVEELLLHRNHQPAQAVRTHSTGWSGAPPSNARPSQRAFAQPKRGFRPAGPMMPR
ncbi:hypothetical protein BD779DRAFT_1667251 [Infundibulicybe gibba]|nr:hypothetical protein BD779DRAFT_1667251 [Infundibulicybe gibba]